MKRIYLTLLFVAVCICCQAVPRIHVIATGGTIAGKLSAGSNNYEAAQVAVETLFDAVPMLMEYAELEYEQFCNIGSQDMDETIWLKLAQRVNSLMADSTCDGIVITHGTDTMEETAFFLNLTIARLKPVILVGSMRASDDPQADGPDNLLVAVQRVIDSNFQQKENPYNEVLCCLGQKVFKASDVFKLNTHTVDAFGSAGNKCLKLISDCKSPVFDISGLETLPQVGIIYGYGGDSSLPLQSFMDAGFSGVVLAGAGMGNFHRCVMKTALEAKEAGMVIVRSSRVPYGGVYTDQGEVDDIKYGFVAANGLSPQKARILLMLALTKTNDIEQIRNCFSE